MNDNHTIICGSKGCGKSEHARKMMGLTPQQYQKECENFNALVSRQMEQRLQQEKLFDRVMMSYYEGL